MIIYSIYRIVNKVNGKIYIGFDSNWPRRKYDHKYFLEIRDQTIYRAFRKYGWNNFDWTVIYQSLDGSHCLNVMEPFFINEYDSYKFGYNETLGGEGCLGRINSPTTRQKQSISMTGKYIGKDNPMFGRKHKPESRSRMGNKGKAKPKVSESMSPGTFHTPWGSFISAREAVKHPNSTVKYYGTLRDYCINCDKPRIKFLGKRTPLSCGFSFVPA